jgi:glycosyltransferase involved in cell wall biosynthesis
MRVLILHAGYRVPAGEDTVVANEAAALTAGGHEVRTHVVSNPNSLGAAVHALAKSFNNRGAAEFVTAEIADFQPDIVHIHNTWFALSSSVASAAAATGTPTVMTIHNYRLGCLSANLFRGDSVCTTCVGRTPLRGVIHGCYRGSRVLSLVAASELTITKRRQVFTKNIDRFVAPSRFVADRMLDIGLPAERLTVKPHFVADCGPRDAPPSASNEVVYIGRLAAGKGLHTLMRAWEHFRSSSRHPDVADLSLTIIGDGPLASELKEAAPRGVTFEGWLTRNEVMERLLRARAFVFPSAWYEPFGMVLVEALSAGTAIVLTNASEAPAITAAPPELIAPVEDDAALAAAIGRLDDATVDRVGAANRRRFETNYTEAIGLQHLEELYHDVIDNG